MNLFVRNKITYVSFLLGVLVIWVHAVNERFFMVSSRLQQFLGTTVGQIAVPGFFMLSSYLFFRDFCLAKTGEKYERRFRSLVIPYLLWNLIYYIGYMIIGRASFTIPALFKAVFFYDYNPAFWYMLQLILLVAASPLIYLCVKKLWSAVLMLVIVGILVFFDVRTPGINPDALFYYTVGAVFSLHFKDAAESKGSLTESLLGLVMICLGAFCIFLAGISSRGFFLVLMRTLCPIGLWMLIPACKTTKVYGFTSNNFLTYATHWAIVNVINKTGAFLLPNTLAAANILYLIMPLITIVIVCFSAYLLRKYLPKAYRLLSGNR